MRKRQLGISVIVVAMMASLLWAKFESGPPSGHGMVEAATKFLASITAEQKSQATFAYDDAERLNWHFIPRERKGLPLKALEGPALASAKALIASGLSTAGYDQTLNIMSLEEVLYLLEGGERDYRRDRRDPQKYYLSVFGEPSLKGTWGWRVEGHHLSLNYTIKDGQVIASTPEFFGANPGTIDAGVGRQIRVLGPEEDIARQILTLCSPDQKKIAYIDAKAPDDLRGGGVAQPETTPPVGLPASDMSPDQKKLLGELLDEYLKNAPADVTQKRREELIGAGMQNIHFAWWGGEELNEPHYYRVQGPTFIIEYNNTQNNANHVHSMWRNLAGDFNIALEPGK